MVYPRFYPRIGAQFDGPIRTHDALGCLGQRSGISPGVRARRKGDTERCPVDWRHDDATLVQHRRHTPRLAIIAAYYFLRIFTFVRYPGEAAVDRAAANSAKDGCRASTPRSLAASPLPERLRLLLGRLAQNEKPVAHRPDPLKRPH